MKATVKKSLAIIGLGAWGVCVLERVVSALNQDNVHADVHLVQPGGSAGGIYAANLPDYLILNNPCGQLSLFARPTGGSAPSYGLGLYEWAVSNGYRWHGDRCAVGKGGRDIRPGDYLPRRMMGEYLNWFCDELVSNAAPGIHVIRHDTEAVDCVPFGSRELLLLADGTKLDVDHVFITTGHTWNDEPSGDDGVHELRPYPVEHFDEVIAPGDPVAVSGLGLVAFDLVAALTSGRGGRFVPEGSGLAYVRTGREPVIHLFSRTGIPSAAKSAQGIDPTGSYVPVACTAGRLDALRRSPDGCRRPVDFRRDVLPLIFLEMRVRYAAHTERLRGGEVAEQRLISELRAAEERGVLEPLLDRLAVGASFEPERCLFPGVGRRWSSRKEYESCFFDMVSNDVRDALTEGGSPLKAAQEVTRILRDQLRGVIELGALSLDSYRDFQSSIRPRINRLDAGPPVRRCQELLALMEAGLVQVPFGPGPTLRRCPEGIAVRSSRLDDPEEIKVKAVLRGHLEMPSVERSVSPLIQQLHRQGRLSQLRYGDTAVGSVAVDELHHPIDARGRPQQGLFLLGVLTEGSRYFTHYIPSPKSRLRAVLDAEACVEAALGSTTAPRQSGELVKGAR